jgi:hypothetical protein
LSWHRLSGHQYLFVVAAMSPSVPGGKKRHDVKKKNQEEGHNDRDAAKPCEHQRAVAGTGRRSGNTDNIVEVAE